MNIATPQEQFASRKRLDALFRKQELRPIRLVPQVTPPVSEPKTKRKYWSRATTIKWHADRCPWPCYADINASAVLLSHENLDRVRVQDVIRVVSEQYGFSEEELLSARRQEPLALARHIAMYLAKVCTGRSYPEIARRLVRDHTTIMHGVRRIEKLMTESSALLEEVKTLRTRLESGN